MKPWTLIAVAGLALAAPAELSPNALAGDLNPPQGAIAPTMKPLDALMPGRCLEDVASDEGATRLITEPGLYVMTQDLVGEDGKDGVRVNCDAFPPGEHTIIIDLQGHAMRGIPGAANAIFVHNSDPATRSVHVVVRGSVRGGADAPGALITGWSVDGVHVEGATSCAVSSVRVTDCAGDGFESTASPPSGTAVVCYTCNFSLCGGNGVLVTLPAGGDSSLDIQEVSCLHNTNNGARVYYAGPPSPALGKTRIRVASMDASHNSLSGLHVSIGDESISMDADDLRTAANGGDGTRLSVDRTRSRSMSADFRRCSSSGNGGHGTIFVVGNDAPSSVSSLSWTSCSSSSNGLSGFRCDGSSSSGSPHTFVWNSCVSLGNGSHGFHMSCPPDRPYRCTLERCSSSSNAGDGVRADSADLSVDFCDLSENTGAGLSSSNSHVRCADGSCRANGAEGITLSDSSGTRRASIDQMRCEDNGSDGISCVGLASLSVSDSSCSSNGRGPGGGGGLLCGNTDHFLCVSSSFAGNSFDGVSISNCPSVTLTSLSCVGNGTGPVGGHGIVCSTVTTCVCSSLVSTDNTGYGAHFSSCDRLRAASCDFSDNDLDGMRCSSGGSFRVSSTTCQGNAGHGLACVGMDGDGRLDLLTCGLNLGDGVHVSDFGLSRLLSVSGCVSSSNGGDGLAVASSVGLGCGAVSIERCVSSENAGSGMMLECSSRGTVRRCEASSNGAWGVLVSGNGHVVIENTASSNSSGNFLVSTPGNTLGPLVDEGGIVQNSNPGANYVR